MDKSHFSHRFKGLRTFEKPAQALCRTRTLTGQKNAPLRIGDFRTFDPVDMQGFIHSGPIFGADRLAIGLAAAFRRVPGSSARVAEHAFETASGIDVAVVLVSLSLPEPLFFGPCRIDRNASQVYKLKLKYRIVIVVNAGAHLWISQVLSTTSSAYAPYKRVVCPCMLGRQKLDKICRSP